MEKNKNQKIFYGWIIVAACVILRFAIGIPNYSLGVFLKAVSEDLGVSRAAFSASYTFTNVATMIMLPILGIWFKKYNFKMLMLIGAIMTTIALYGYSFTDRIWVFYLFATINGIFSGMINSIPIVMLISNWFVDKRGFATGLAFAGSGISSMLVTPLANYLIINMRWQIAFQILAVIYLVFTMVPIIFMIKVKPSELGLLPLGSNGNYSKDAELTGFTRNEALKTSTFWLIGIAMFSTGFVLMGVQQHVIAYLSDIGHTSTFAANIYSIIMFFDTIGKIILGLVYDKLKLRKGNIYIYGIFFTSIVLLVFSKDPIIAVIYAIFMGLAGAVQTGAYPIIISKLLGDKDYGLIYGNLTVCYFGGMSMGIPFSGYIFDNFGSYIPAWKGYSIAVVFILVILFAAEKTSKKELKKITDK